MTDSECKTKLRAESHIDELAQVSKGNDRVVPDNKNHPFAKDGFTYRTAYFKDPSGYYRVTMSVGINGEINTVYNVGEIKEADFPVDDVRGAQRPRGKQASDNSVYKNAGDVNRGNDMQQSSRDLPETEAFKKWFGDSKVVNADGTPKVMYQWISWVIRDANQIKSATDNVGTFDPENPDIRYSQRDLPETVSIREHTEKAGRNAARRSKKSACFVIHFCITFRSWASSHSFISMPSP